MKGNFQYQHWSRINLAVDDISASSRNTIGHLVAIKGTIILILHLSLQSHGQPLNHWKGQFTYAWYSIEICDLAKWYNTYPINPVVATIGSMPPGLCYICYSVLNKPLVLLSGY